MVRRRWRWAVVLGVVVALILSIAIVLSEPATPGPEGIALLGTVLWRGVAYSAADGLLLSAFPILAVFAATEGSRLRRRKSGTVAVGVAALLASLVMATVYHLGYRDFRSPMLARPVTADLVWSVPTPHPQPDWQPDHARRDACDRRPALLRDAGLPPAPPLRERAERAGRCARANNRRQVMG